ncbi:MAG: hypothetical protein ACQEWD_11370 [Bacteroidota bacterium]
METIYNIPQLIDLIERKNLNSKQICKILSEGFRIYADQDQDRESLLTGLKEYWRDYSNSIDKPLFLGCEIDVDSYLEEQETGKKLFSNPEYKTPKAAIISSLKNKKGMVGCEANNTIYLMGEPFLKFANTSEINGS